MNLFEFADLIGAEINITRYKKQKGRLSCDFVNCEIAEDGVLIGVYGNGVEPYDAINDYTSKISNRRIRITQGRDLNYYNVPQLEAMVYEKHI